MNLLLYTHAFITSLVFTCVVETIILFLLVRYWLKGEQKTADLVFAGIFASFATITYVWYVFPVIATWPPHGALLWAEPFAFIVEAVFYRFFLKLSWKEAFIVSFLANLASFIGGRALRAVGLWVQW